MTLCHEELIECDEKQGRNRCIQLRKTSSIESGQEIQTHRNSVGLARKTICVSLGYSILTGQFCSLLSFLRHALESFRLYLGLGQRGWFIGGRIIRKASGWRSD